MKKVTEAARTVHAARVNLFARRCFSFSCRAQFLFFFLLFCTGPFLAAGDLHTKAENAEQSDEAVQAAPIIHQAELRLRAAGYSGAEIDRVVHALRDASRKGIPAQLLQGRVQEGAAKQVPSGRLVAVLERNIEYLEHARQSLTEIDNGPALIAEPARWQRAANMLAAGISAGELAALGRICAHVPEEFRPLSVLYVSLVKWGLESETTIAVAEALVRSPIPASEYEGVSDLFRKARKFRISPEELSTRIIDQAVRVADIEELERRILR